jgi:hypothetical protein
MSLREHLKDLLPELLPADPNDAIKGTELIRLVKFRLRQNYSDATLRYHFSVMSCDPTTPIAKVAQGQGYYQRPNSRPNLGGPPHLIAFRQQTMVDLVGKSPDEINRDLLHAEKFRAIVARFLLHSQRFPFFFEDSLRVGSPAENVWRYPDAMIVDWPCGEAGEQDFRLQPDAMERRRMLQAPLYYLTSLKLRLRVGHDSLREEFFQCLSHGEWTHGREFYLALPVDDASLADSLAALGQRYGVGILSFGFSAECLDDLPEASAIPRMKPIEFDAVLARAQFNRLAAPDLRPHPEWSRIDDSQRDNPDLAALFNWLAESIASGTPRPSAGWHSADPVA